MIVLTPAEPLQARLARPRSTRPSPPVRSKKGLTRKAHATRTLILEATLQVIAQEGYAAATRARVADAAGVVRGVINYHFHDHTQFLRAVIGHIERRKSKRLAALSPCLDLDRRHHVSGAIDTYWAMLHEPPFVAFAELEHAARTEPDLQTLLAERAGADGRTHIDPFRTPRSQERQPLYDLTRFLLEGLAHGSMSHDRAARETRLFEALKQIAMAF